jgi:predicted membrane protein
MDYHHNILNLVFFFFVIKIYCGNELFELIGGVEKGNDNSRKSSHENACSTCFSERVILIVALVFIAIIFFSVLLVLIVIVGQRKKAKAAKKREKDKLTKREERSKKSVEQVGYKRKWWGQEFLINNEEEYIDQSIFHPLPGLRIKLCGLYLFIFFILFCFIFFYFQIQDVCASRGKVIDLPSESFCREFLKRHPKS